MLQLFIKEIALGYLLVLCYHNCQFLWDRHFIKRYGTLIQSGFCLTGARSCLFQHI